LLLLKHGLHLCWIRGVTVALRHLRWSPTSMALRMLLLSHLLS
jgi:hypothetical protein